MKRDPASQLIDYGTRSWPQLRARARRLTDAELAEAERLERLGMRRENMLMVLKAERHRRQNRPEKMIRLHIEANL